MFYCVLLFPAASKNCDTRLDRKFVSSAFFWHEMEEEFRGRNIDWCFKGSDSDAMEAALAEINDLRQGGLYQHKEENCSSLCKEKGSSSNLAYLVIFNLIHLSN